jgi:hypothetical protein
MSRGLDRDDNDQVEKSDRQSRMSLSKGRVGHRGKTEDDRADREQGNARARREQRPLTHVREEVRYGRHRYEWSFTEQAVIRELGGRRTRDSYALTRRCFLDHFPLFTRPGAKELAFCYVDSGCETSGPFVTHLRQCLPLFAELPSFDLVYVATASTRVGQAHTVFERALSRGHQWLTKVADPDRLLAPFRDRQLFDKRETNDFDRLRFDALRDDMYCFSGRHFARMFARWETFGDEAIRAEIAVQKMPDGRFSSCTLPHDYNLFGSTEATS